ncbi:hypothetical protein EYL16_08440, partial [Neisseria gonorrhoeae]
ALPYYLYCLRLRRLVLIFVNPLYDAPRPPRVGLAAFLPPPSGGVF